MTAFTPSDDTFLRWKSLSPDDFIPTVLHGQLENAINDASVRIHIYTRIVRQYLGCHIQYQDTDAHLSETFSGMRTCIAEAAQLIRAERWDGNKPEQYIIETMSRIQWCIKTIQEWAQSLRASSEISKIHFRAFNNCTVIDALNEIAVPIKAIEQLVQFSSRYAHERLRLLHSRT